MQPSTRPAAGISERFVDARNGNDANNGELKMPWRTVQHAVSQLQPGDTLYLRNGTYRERLTISIAGRPDQPITIRSYPGELAVIDGSLADFCDAPAEAWEPVQGGAAGEYRSKRAYPNARDFIGAFGDSMIGLQTYWHLEDLRSDNELWDEEGVADVKPVYVGPGLYYDAATGRIHIRLAKTHLKGDAVNYAGETDPRQLPLLIAPFRSVPLHVDGGKFLRFQDLMIRGGGYDTVVLEQATSVEFDNVTVYCGTYGLRAANTRGLRFLRSALYGNLPPWGFRNENSLRDRPGRGKRDIARLSGHALLVGETGFEFSVYANPTNDDWEISHSSFTDCHDGLYLGGVNVRFHHNRIDNMQDDGIYISPVYAYTGKTDVHIYQNQITRCLTAFALGGPLTDVKETTVHIYRNIVDMREGVNASRPTPKKPEAVRSLGNMMGDHGSPPWPKMNIYQNTFVMSASPRQSSMGLLNGIRPGDPARQVLNNAFVTLGKLPAYMPPSQGGSVDGGNLYWGANMAGVSNAQYFGKYLQAGAATKSATPGSVGSTTKPILADPQFIDIANVDFRLKPGSAAVNAGVDLPGDWPDPLRTVDAGAPDIGALPLDAAPLQAGRESSR